jgi:acetylornithine/LysW-gamma-L-lysine aminotransferase
MSAIPDREDQFTSGVYAKRPLAIVKGSGASLWDDTGREYIDCVGGQGVANIGHSHPAVVDAVARQAEILITCPEAFYNDRRAELLEALIDFSPGGLQRVFLCNSGAEAVEAAVKFARFKTGRTGIVAAMRGFHGRTLGALSATWSRKYREPFEPLVPGFAHIPYNNLAALEEALDEGTAAVLLEVVQGEGGVILGEREFLVQAQSLCRQRGALLIVDEVQTGFGRTGRWFAFEHHDLEPDMVCVAKSMAGGLPMGAVLLSERVGSLPPGIHGSTFGGNPLACAAALAALGVMREERLAEKAEELGSVLLARLAQIDSPIVREVRGLGLIVGVELKRKVAPVLAALMERRILALNAGPTVLRLLPPLVISRSQVEMVADAIGEVLAE